MSADRPQDETNNQQGGPAPGLMRNAISLVGAALALVSAANIAFLIFIDYITGRPSPYIGILAYMILPGFLLLGLLLIPIGMLVERHRRRRKLQPAAPSL